MAEVLPAHPMEERPDDKLPAIAEVSGGSNQPPPPPEAQEQSDHASLPDIHSREIDSSTESLIKALGLSGADEKSLGRLLKTVRGQVLSTIDELRTITTHDDNLERQYKEVVSENVQLNSALEKARGEIRHLKGQLSVLHMTSPEVRKYRARAQLRERRKQDHERQLQQSRQKYLGSEPLSVLDFGERARIVNARGEYIDHRQLPHSRHSTYPPAPLPSSVSLPPPSRPHTDPLPPPLLGCRCSVCHSQQSLGAVTVGSRLHPQPPSPQHRSSPHLTKSGQQILLGDKVIIKGERPGVVRYIGRLEADVQGQIFIGVHLVMPVGTCDGSLRGRHYFQCPPLHGVFVKPADVLCVTGRKPCTGGTVVPRLQERAPFGTGGSKRGSKLQTPLHWGPQAQEVPTPASSFHSASTATKARTILQEELARAHTTSSPQSELFDASVQEMSRRMEDLARKNKLKIASQQQQKQQREETPPTAPSHSPSLTEPQSPPPPTTPTPPPQPQPITPPPPEKLPTPTPPPSPPVPAPEEEEEPWVTTPPPPRSETPLETVLLRALRAKDLGSTGFVTGNEISATLTELSRGKAMTEAETELLLEGLGIPKTESGGFPYTDVIPYLAQAIESTQSES